MRVWHFQFFLVGSTNRFWPISSSAHCVVCYFTRCTRQLSFYSSQYRRPFYVNVFSFGVFSIFLCAYSHFFNWIRLRKCLHMQRELKCMDLCLLVFEICLLHSYTGKNSKCFIFLCGLCSLPLTCNLGWCESQRFQHFPTSYGKVQTCTRNKCLFWGYGWHGMFTAIKMKEFRCWQYFDERNEAPFEWVKVIWPFKNRHYLLRILCTP